MPSKKVGWEAATSPSYQRYTITSRPNVVGGFSFSHLVLPEMTWCRQRKTGHKKERDAAKPTSLSPTKQEVLFSNYFNQHPFPPAAVKLTIKDLLPGAEVQAASGYGDYHFPSHDLSFEVGIPVILTRSVVMVA